MLLINVTVSMLNCYSTPMYSRCYQFGACCSLNRIMFIFMRSQKTDVIQEVKDELFLSNYKYFF